MERWGPAILIPVGVVLFTVVVIFAISRLLLVFNDQAIATTVALALALIVLVGAIVLDRRPRAPRPH
ncbi:MAG TPA: hypothetical protein VHL09_16105 [Dehalococcoidia bacterium]|nr:hypothetical protein [Dehalococcoidia bacterium]